MRDEYHDHRISDGEWERLFARQAERLDLAREWWAWAGGREGARVADVGCGPGFLAMRYAEWAGVGGRVLALDAQEGALAFLDKRLPPGLHGRVSARRFDAEREALADAVEIVLLTNVLHHLRDPVAALRNVQAPGRTLLVADYDPLGPGERGPPTDERIPPATLAAWLAEAGWRAEAPRAQRMEQYAIVARG
jgi:SAM-dependent methyltransferase